MGSSRVHIDVPLVGQWVEDGACRRRDDDLFFPVGNSLPALAQTNEAKKECRRCPVRFDCARWALEAREDHGVWGGLDEGQRASIWRKTGGWGPRAEELVREQWAREDVGPVVALYLQSTVSSGDGHVEWVGARSNRTIGDASYTVLQVAFEVCYRRRPVGSVLRSCGVKGCVAGEHLTDELMRGAA